MRILSQNKSTFFNSSSSNTNNHVPRGFEKFIAQQSFEELTNTTWDTLDVSTTT